MKCADPNSLRALLKKKQLKMTPQRQRILQVFCEHPDSHLSAEDVYQIVRDDASDIGLATVYRTLELLSELDLLSQINFGDGRSRYELNRTGEGHHHHHLICISCGKVAEFDDDLLDQLEKEVAVQNGFQILDHQVKFFGHCKECQQREQSK
jgi:Fur family ferric uptake transcriptional regulator